jgi:predicted nucleic acid-binding protein
VERLKYLVGTSVLARANNPAVSARLVPLIRDRAAAGCGIVTLELLYSARNQSNLRAIREEQNAALVPVPITQEDFARAADTMDALAAHGQHRTAPIPDLIIAAVAVRADLTVLHYDQDFEAIAAVTGQPHEWVVPRGSL